MSTATKSTTTGSDSRALSVKATDDEIIAHLTDGRRIAAPLAWSWRLTDATPEQRANWQLVGGGEGFHWPDVDEDLSVRGMLEGIPAVRPTARKG